MKHKLMIVLALLAALLCAGFSVYWARSARLDLTDFMECYHYDEMNRQLDDGTFFQVGIYIPTAREGWNDLAAMNVGAAIERTGRLPQSYRELYIPDMQVEDLPYYIIAYTVEYTQASEDEWYLSKRRIVANMRIYSGDYADHLPEVVWLDDETVSIAGRAVNIYGPL